jgi:hypothetical protein
MGGDRYIYLCWDVLVASCYTAQVYGKRELANKAAGGLSLVMNFTWSPSGTARNLDSFAQCSSGSHRHRLSSIGTGHHMIRRLDPCVPEFVETKFVGTNGNPAKIESSYPRPMPEGRTMRVARDKVGCIRCLSMEPFERQPPMPSLVVFVEFPRRS